MMIFLIMVLILITGVFYFKRFKILPKKSQVFIEMIYEGILNLISEITNGDKKHSKILFPIIGAMLVYLTIANIIGLIPGLSQITVGEYSLFSTPTADFNTTFGLALGSILIINLISIKRYGFLDYFGNFFKFRELYRGFKKD